MVRRGDSAYDELYEDPSNWRLGIVYACTKDPRLVVPNRYFIGWTWNFGHPRVFPSIFLVVCIAVGPVFIAWYLDFRHEAALLAVFFASLLLAIFTAMQIARAGNG